MTIVQKNERSWAIELITQINHYCEEYDLIIRRAGGESTILERRGKSMFPDVILYGDRDLSAILQGWELKMPDILIDNEEFIADAQRKAKALNLSSCVIWNFTYARLYVYDEHSGVFTIKKEWSNEHIKTRNDVLLYKVDWKETLKDVLNTVNDYLVSGHIKRVPVSEVLSNTSLSIIVNENKSLVAENLEKAALKDALLEANVSVWWEEIKTEYEGDETDKYQAYAKSIIINWTNRILFAHLIKGKQKDAYAIDKLDESFTPEDANKLFSLITEKCDFYNIFASLPYNDCLPSITWKTFIDLSLFLKDTFISNISQQLLQQVLENTVNIAKREVNGQYTTPQTLARILSRITVHDMTADCFDCCCGTGTISSSVLQLKKHRIGASAAMKTTWASDKFQLPLQIANLSMTSYDTIDIPCKVFKADILKLSIGSKVDIVNPRTGKNETFEIPRFHSIVSNLPFVNSSHLPADDNAVIAVIKSKYELTGRSDYSYYIALHIASLVSDGGYVGLILSNSFLGTEAGAKFLNAIRSCFDDIRIHISGKGKWFANADVVTALIVMRKRTGKEQNQSISFFTWHESLAIISVNKLYEDTIVNSSLLDKEINPDIITRVNYKKHEIEELRHLNISYNSMFTDLRWLSDIRNCIVPICDIMHVFRGSRRGWDALFFPENSESIEPQFLKDVLLNARNTDSYIAETNRKAFCCSMEIAELQANGYTGALTWIRKFENQKNGTGKLLPDVLATCGRKWYELCADEMAEFFTMMNPDNRLFYGRFLTPAFINQRLIGLRRKNPSYDSVLLHALLNSILSLFYIEAVGFGRGLGVLDINKDSISCCYMLDPSLLTAEQVEKIKKLFSHVINRGIVSVSEEFCCPLRKEFDITVLEAYGISNYYERIVKSLESLRTVRKAVKAKRVILSTKNNCQTAVEPIFHKSIAFAAEGL